MNAKSVKRCPKCREVIQWEMLPNSRMRVFTMSPKGNCIYATRCGCGDVRRQSNGRRAR